MMKTHSFFTIAAFCVLLSAPLSYAQDTKPLVRTDDAQYFDFWEGTWYVVNDNNTIDTNSYFKVKRSVHPAAFEEEWQFKEAGKSVALRAWDKTNNKWGFVWVSSNGLYQVWDTKKVDGHWYIYKQFTINGDSYLSRQGFLPQPDGTVLRVSEKTYDEKTWELRFKQRLKKAQPSPALESLIKAERGFAALSVASGTRAAFLANLAEDGILFNPGPTNGKKIWEERPTRKSVLAWEPAFADVAASGDMGYTFGPWKWSAHKDTLASGFGHFISVWKKQQDGAWKVASDLGISYPEPFPKPVNVKISNTTSSPQYFAKTESGAALLIAADKEFALSSQKNDAVRAYQSVAADDIVFFRVNHHPMYGKNSIAQSLFEKNASVTWEPIGGDIAQSGDLGYTFGSYSFVIDGKSVKAGYYKRIWRRWANASWKIMVDVTNPLPQ